MAIRASFPIAADLASDDPKSFGIVVERNEDFAVWNGTAFVVPTAAAPVVPFVFPAAFLPWSPPGVATAIQVFIPTATTGTWADGYYSCFLHKLQSDGKTPGPLIAPGIYGAPLFNGDDNATSQTATFTIGPAASATH